MPHLTLEISANLRSRLEGGRVLDAAHQALLASGVFDALDVKTRLLWVEAFRIGAGADGHGFVHARLEMLSGRPEVVRKQLADAVAQAVAGSLPPMGIAVQISCEARDMQRDCYARTTRTD